MTLQLFLESCFRVANKERRRKGNERNMKLVHISILYMAENWEKLFSLSKVDRKKKKRGARVFAIPFDTSVPL